MIMKIKFTIVILAITIFTSIQSSAQGDLFLTPRRIIFDAGKTYRKC